MNDFAEFSKLEALLNDEAVGEECLSFIEAHAYLSASIISPRQTSAEQLLEEIVGEGFATLDAERKSELQAEISGLTKFIERQLLAGEALDLPLELDMDDDENFEDLESWCFSFMEKHLADEDAWFEQGGDEIAQMLLPVVAASGIFEDPEIDNIRQDKDLFFNMIADIPELMIDLYVVFHEKQDV